MENQKFDINKLRIASPCSLGWENMTGDERVRHCDSCQLKVYNIAGMTNGEVEKLFADREGGRLCIRLYKRADGTVLTKDCPVGFRAYRKRIARFAGATLAAVLGLFSVSFGQNEKPIDGSKIEITETENQTQESVLFGVITDLQGAFIPNAKIKLFKKGDKTATEISSDAEGKYSFNSLTKGVYKLEIQSVGFAEYIVKKIEIKPKEKNKLDIILHPEDGYVTVGIYAETEPTIDVTSSSVQTIITSEQIQRLPF